MNINDTLLDLAIAPLAGYVGTKVMEPVSMSLYQLEPESDRNQEDAVRPGAPYRIAAQKTLDALGVHLEGEALERAALVFHYGLAIGWASTYSLVRRTTSMNPITAGLACGAAMSLLVDEWMTPALGFSAPNNRYPMSTHLRGFAAHIVFGLAIAAVTEMARAVLKRPS